jgi:hypothetical protein
MSTRLTKHQRTYLQHILYYSGEFETELREKIYNLDLLMNELNGILTIGEYTDKQAERLNHLKETYLFIGELIIIQDNKRKKELFEGLFGDERNYLNI